MISRLRGRRAFDQLAHGGTRINHFPLWCTWCHSTDGPSLGFAITRALGPAVTRNRLRRRLRAIVREFDRTHPLPPVNLLIGARPQANELTFEELVVTTEKMLTQIPVSTAPRNG